MTYNLAAHQNLGLQLFSLKTLQMLCHFILHLQMTLFLEISEDFRVLTDLILRATLGGEQVLVPSLIEEEVEVIFQKSYANEY